MEKTDIMVDIETLGTRADASIIEIAAVKFCGEDIISKFFTTVNHKLSDNCGLAGSVDLEACRFWENTISYVPDNLGDYTIMEALLSLEKWLGEELRTSAKTSTERLWAKPASFDFPILESALHRCGMKPLWSYKDLHCMRTAVNLCKSVGYDPGKGVRDPVHHALCDAQDQIIVLNRALTYLGVQ